jgi:ABC-2 type transport system permease protein
MTAADPPGSNARTEPPGSDAGAIQTRRQPSASERRSRPAGSPAATMPSAWRIGLARGRIEVKQFFREKDEVVFTFLFPVIMLLIFGSIFSWEIGDTGVDAKQVLATGIVAAGIMGSSFTALGVQIAIERDNGTLKRLRGTPMPKVSYFVGKVVLVLVTSVAQNAILLVLGTTLFGLELPNTAGRWLTFLWVVTLGIVACSLLGVAVSSAPRSGRSAPAVINLPYIVLQFISGVFFVFSELPENIQRIAAVFPLKWMCQGLRSAFLPDSFQAMEPAGSWEYGRTALVLGVWMVAGLALCLWGFRWRRRDEG